MAEQEVVEEYRAALLDLTSNKKPLITMLTMLADEGKEHASAITHTIVTYIKEVEAPYKLPVMYLIDSIVKNVGEEYRRNFGTSIAHVFSTVFRDVSESTRKKLFELRLTWNEVFPKSRLYYLDNSCREIDPAWPITSQQTISQSPNIHVNPKFRPTAIVHHPSTSKAPINTFIQPTPNPTDIEELKNLQTQKKVLAEKRRKVEKLLKEDRITTDHKTTSTIHVAPWAANKILPTISDSNSNRNSKLHQRGATDSSPKHDLKSVKEDNFKDPKALISKFPPALQKSIIPVSTGNASADIKSKNNHLASSPSKRQKDLHISPLEVKSNRSKEHLSSQELKLKSKKNSPTNFNAMKIKKDCANKEKVDSTKEREDKIREKKIRKEKEEIMKKEKEEIMKREKEELLKKEKEEILKKEALEKLEKSKKEEKERQEKELKEKKAKEDKLKLEKELRERLKKEQLEAEKEEAEAIANLKEEKLKKEERDRKKEKKRIREKKKSADEPKSKKERKDPNIKQNEKTKALKRRREHIRPRDSSPEDIAKKIKEEVESEDSDHYDANKPLPEKYTLKKDLKPIETDTDLRLLTNQENNQTPEKSNITTLFGSSDTDLRQLPSAVLPAVFPPRTPTVPLGVVPLNPFDIVSDEDLRTGKKPDLPKNLKVLQAEEKKKTSFSSPHADKWEKFRAKNPEFKEYQRQASLNERLEFETGHQSVLDRNRGRSSFMDKDSRPVKHLGPNIENPMNSKFKSEEHYLYKVNELNAQRHKGAISIDEYNRIMEDIRIQVETDKICEVRARDNSRPPAEKQQQAAQVTKRPIEDMKQERYNDRERNYGPNFPGRFPNRSGPMGPRIEDEWTGEPDLPSISEEVLRTVVKENDTRTIEIDTTPREIRSYGETAIILLDWNDPRMLTFEKRAPCNVIFDQGQFTLTLSTGENYRELKIDGISHRIKLGVPTQELMIDGKGYQCFFGGKAISVYLANKDRTIRLDGRPPKVDIGKIKNMEYLAGKIELIIQARKVVPLFLDAKPQRFSIDGIPFVIKFIDSFRSVAINGVQFSVVFGGLPISISVRGYRRFLRFSSLPPGVTPGQLNIRGMDVDGTNLIPLYTSSSLAKPVAAPLIPQSSLTQGGPLAISQPLPQAPHPIVHPPVIGPPQAIPHSMPKNSAGGPGPLHPLNVPPPFVHSQFSNPPPSLPFNQPPPGPGGIVPGSYLTSAPHAGQPQLVPKQPSIAPTINVQSLLNQLVKTGIIGGASTSTKPIKETPKVQDSASQPKPEEEDVEEDIDDLKELPPIEYMFSIDNLRKPNTKLIKKMYRGMQCSSCGLRYPPEQTAQYSHHLDWHFRMNKKQQESIKKVNTRKYYLYIEDWLQYEEIEDSEERVPSMFENEGEVEGKLGSKESPDREEEIPSVAANSSNPSSGLCPICHETFDQFYNQSTEEWHYKYAIQVDDINYHPTCHLDLIKSQKNEEERLKNEAEQNALKEEQKENEEIKLNNDEVKTNEEENNSKEDEPKSNVDEKNENEIAVGKEEDLNKTEKVEEKIEVPVPVQKELEHDETKDEEIKVVKENIEEEPKLEFEEIKRTKPAIHVTTIEDESDDDKENATPTKTKDIKETRSHKEATFTIDHEVYKNVIKKTRSYSYSHNTVEGEQNGISEIHVKEEPMDGVEEGKAVFVPLFETKWPVFDVPFSADIPIKVEVPDVDDSDNIIDVGDDDDENRSDQDMNDSLQPVGLPGRNLAMPDMATSIDGNTEHSTPATTQEPLNVPKIKITVSKPTTTPSINNDDANKDSNHQNEESQEAPGFLDEFPSDFTPPPFSVNYDKKPGLKGVEIRELPKQMRGVEEMSSLCSIM